MVFAVMFEPQTGLINSILRTLGMDAINWLGGEMLYGEVANPSKFSAMFVLIFYIVWNSLPFKILIFMSALQSIDKQYYQAAQIDGTSKARTLWRITVPLLSPQILYLMITSFIGAFKSYNSVIAIFGDQAKPYGATTNTMATVVWSIYNSIGAQQQGVASAGAVVLFIIIMIITAIQSAVSKKRVHY
jgi:multiple sugar transport system permease protein